VPAPQFKSGAFFIRISTAIIDASDAGLVPGDMIEHRLDDMGLHAEVAHTGGHRAAKVVQPPCGHRHRHRRTAEVVAGAIAMGFGGYLAARTDAEHYAAEESRENYEIEHLREKEVEEVETIFREYGLEGKVLQNVVNAIAFDAAR
jgi:VIT family protein